MRISEIANAEEQIGLLKIIIDKTWEALATQQRQQAQQAQQKAASKPRAVKPASTLLTCLKVSGLALGCVFGTPLQSMLYSLAMVSL